MKKRLSNKVARDVFLLEDYRELVPGRGALLETAWEILAAQCAIKQRHTPEAE